MGLLRPGGETMSMMKGPYENHYYELGSVIRNTVSQAQDTLCRLKLGRETQEIQAKIDRLFYGDCWPQTLGELCIELAQDGFLKWHTGGDPCHENVRRWWKWRGLLEKDGMSVSRRDIQELRTLMYHKHKDPAKELKMQRIERMIRLVQFV